MRSKLFSKGHCLLKRFSIGDRRLTSSVCIEQSNNKQLLLETGRLARFTDASVSASVDQSFVLSTVVSKQTTGSNLSFLPLIVDFRQKASAIGRIPSNFLRRELNQTDQEILVSRTIDRSIRTLFPQQYRCETQVVCNLVVLDEDGDPAVMAINATSAALSISNIPWNGPVAAVRLALIDDKAVVNPTRRELKESRLNMLMTGLTGNKVVMVDIEGSEISVNDLEMCLDVGLQHIAYVAEKINQFAAENGKPKREVSELESDKILEEEMRKLAEDRIAWVFGDPRHDKISRDEAINAIRLDTAQQFEGVSPQLVEQVFHRLAKKIFRDMIIDHKVRCDGRKMEELRPISCEVDVYERLHGSALFQRGQTQVLASVSFDSKLAAFRADAVSVLSGAPKRKAFMLHYEFPPYATNETGQMRGVNRRELGHGALAEKALKRLVPVEFPFTIRLSCEVLESNGSSSMASCCAGSLALMDAGVQISSPAAGVAVGLICRPEDNSYQLMTDLSGIEDYHGDMDLKIAGTNRGITAMQMDLKISGLDSDIFCEAIRQGERGLHKVLSIMAQTLSHPRLQLKENGPVSQELTVAAHKRSQVIGAGGYNLRLIESETGVQFFQEDQFRYTLFAPNPQAMQTAQAMIAQLTEEKADPVMEFGEIFIGRIDEIKEMGVTVLLKKHRQGPFMANSFFVPNKDLSVRKVSHASALGMKVGDEMAIKYLGRDPVEGKHRLSMRLARVPGALAAKTAEGTASPWH